MAEQKKQNVAANVGGKVVKEVVKKTTKQAISELSAKAVDAIATASGVGAFFIPFIDRGVKLLVSKSIDLISKSAKGLRDLGAGLLFMAGAGAQALFYLTLAWALAFLSAITIPFFTVIIGIPLLTVFTIYIMTVGAWVVPPWEGTNFLSGTDVDSAFIDITKTYAGPQHYENFEVLQDGGVTVNYTITIIAERSALTNVRLEYNCSVRRETGVPPCPPINPQIPQPGDDNYPTTISPGTPYVFTYSQNYSGGSFTDALIRDTFAVTADVEGLTNEVSSASAVVRIGNPPEDCPGGWPIGGYLSRAAYSYGWHSNAEAIDISGESGDEVTATHSGIAHITRGGDLGYNVEIFSSCEGREFFSRYSHLSVISVLDGEEVDYGRIIGARGNTGNSTGPHLHYEFKYDRNNPTGGRTNWTANPPYMMVPYTGKDIPRGCDDCRVNIP